ncbi:hypothetical protein G0Q06_07185 [Puniceicoccales bacterium CK1056]|uniref:Uncharacterized protein n=1 Tax=Oceanipulchritudo coccoides TaxID=2706888 RepID=A0A6B2M1G7_9BACT|nr:hypothetical protein [Oceanipulchritudo coccoides]NDV62226.1 hypothetical protein [Oceanipulchritudo coccoides]
MRVRVLSLALSVVLLTSLDSSAYALSLLDRSPFLWPGFSPKEGDPKAQVAAGAPSDLEFHAVYELSGTTKVLLKDRRKNEFHWIRIGEEVEGMLPKEYNREKDELLLAYDNQEKWLSLQDLPQASGKPSAAVQPARPTNTNQNTTRRRVIRPSNRTTSSSTRNVIRPTSRTSSNVPRPPIRSTRRPVTGDPPVALPPGFVPPEPVGDPATQAPEFLPSLPPGTTPPSKP